ncbi:MAG: hypothetical protein KGI29_02480 [Pseudomonadota bacterium]|nr:hypothetical protein [Pseudomonadota bacterium]MDE3037970.1 hypothetical protein [Pseudomonadota bacterium]
MLKKSSSTIAAIACVALLSGCMANGQQYASDVYQAGQVNEQQEAKTVRILAVLPAKIEVDNTQGQKNAQVIGGLLGALGGAVAGHQIAQNGGQGAVVGGASGAAVGVAAGSLVSNKVLVKGVSITYTHHHKTYNSAQVGRLCEFKPGVAIMITTKAHETRIQPNATCPKAEKEDD